MATGFEAVEDGEILLRRVHEQWVKASGTLSPKAFRPSASDTQGLSFCRSSCWSSEDVARRGASAGSRYFVARLRASDVRRLGLTIVPDSPDGERGHCVVPELKASNAESDATRNGMVQLRAAVLVLDGPWVAELGAR